MARLKDYEQDALRFMDNEIVPFSNNLGENDLRMTKVQQKISGCFRSIGGARFFVAYAVICRPAENKASISHALDLLLNGKLPDFLM